MERVCHRCGTGLEEATSFCPHCGAPQLRLESGAEPGMTPEAQAVESRSHRGILWKSAVVSSLLVSIPVSLLTTVNSLFIVWVIGGGIAAVGLYRKRARGYQVNARAGFRIGIVVGILSSFLTVLFTAGSMVVQRFAMHRGGKIDGLFQAIFDQWQMQMNQSNPEAAAQMMDLVRFFISPDGKAALALSGAAVVACSMIAFSAMGGALGARIFAARNRSLPNV